MAEHLEAVTTGQLRRLLINISPRCSKTSLCSIMWPAWTWARSEVGYLSGPQVRFLCASYGHALSIQNSNMTRRLIVSDWYQRLWGDRFRFMEDQNSKARFDNDRGGSRIATSVGGSLLGIGGDALVLDDPHNIADVESEAELETVLNWWAEFSTTRQNDPQRSAIAVVMQRLGELDVSGKILSDDTDGEWCHVMLPMEYESRRHCVTTLGFHDPRGLDDDGEPLVLLPERLPRDAGAEAILNEREGALMWEERFDRKSVEALKAGLGPYLASGRLQQSPSPKGGGIFQREWFELWDSPDGKFPPCDYIIGSVDGAFTEDEENDPSAMTVWGVFVHPELGKRRIICMDAWRKHLKFSGPRVDRLSVPTVINGRAWPADELRPGMPEAEIRRRNQIYHSRTRDTWGLVETVAHTCRRFKVNKLLIEGKASGISAAQELSNRYAGEGWAIQVMPVKGDKVARALAAQPTFSQYMVYAPDRAWASMLIDEMAIFPKGKYDDLTDSATQAINYLRSVGLAQEDDALRAVETATVTHRSRVQSVAERYYGKG